MEFKIREGRKEDAGFIAEGIMEAIGEEICMKIGERADDALASAKTLFERTASMETSQYSFRNALVAESADGHRAGVLLAYDGSGLHHLRQAFVDIYNEMYGTVIKEADFDDETSPDEIYIDTLAVKPEYRRHGLGGKLIEAAIERHRNSGKPTGLLVDFNNPGARRLYEKSGFKSMGTRSFCGVEMEHMQK